MASSKLITHDQIAEEGVIKKYLHKEFEDLVAYLPTVEAQLKKFAATLKDSLKSFKFDSSSVEDIKKFNETIKQGTVLEEIHNKVKKTKIELTAKEQAQAQINKANKKDEINLLKSEIIELDKTVGSLKRVEAASARLRIERKNINTTTIEGRTRLRELNAELDRNNKYVTENSDKLKQQKLNVGNYTESVKAAFEGTGQLGDAMNKHLSIVVLLSEKIEGLVSWLVKDKVATEGAAVATNLNTVAEEKTVVATEAAIAVEKSNVIALEAQTAATETAAVATNTLGKSLKALATNPYVLAAVAIAGLVKLVIDNVNATQEQKDAWDASQEALLATTNTTIIASVGYSKLYDETKRLFLAEKELEDLRASKLVSTQQLRAEAETAREAAAQAGVTTAQKIKYLDEYITKTKQANDEDTEELQKNLEIKKGYVDLYGKFASRKQREELEAAKAAIQADRADDAAATIRAQKMRTKLIDSYNDDTRSLLQEAQKIELELINTFDDNKSIQRKKELDKQLLQIKSETKQRVDNLKKEQSELGTVGHDGKDLSDEFARELKAKRDEGRKAEEDAMLKYNEDMTKIYEDARKKYEELLEKQKKFQADNLKALQEWAEKKNNINTKQAEIEKKNIGDVAAWAIKKSEENKKLEDDANAGRRKRINEIENTITNAVADGLRERSEIQQEADQRDIDFHTRSIEIQSRLAAEGKENILAEEQAAATKAEEKKLQDAKRAQKIQETITIVKVFADTLNEALDKNKPFIQAFAEAGAASGIVATMFSKLFAGSAYEGTEDTGNAGTVDEKGGKAWILHPNERVIPKRLNDMVSGISNDELIKNALMFENMYVPQFKSTNVSSTSDLKNIHDERMTSVLKNEIQELKKVIEQKPVSNVHLNGLGDWTNEMQSNGLKVIQHHVNKRRSLRLNG